MKSPMRSIGGFSTILLGAMLSWTVSAETIAVVGTGNVGAALGPEFAAQGHTIVYGSREPNREDVQALVARTSGNAVYLERQLSQVTDPRSGRPFAELLRIVDLRTKGQYLIAEFAAKNPDDVASASSADSCPMTTMAAWVSPGRAVEPMASAA